MYDIYFKTISPTAHVPTKAHEDDAGFDMYASESVLLRAHEFAAVPTGICIQLPPGTEAQVRPRSGLAMKNGVTVLNSPGTVDAGYRGELRVILINHSSVDFQITPGMRIAQMIIAPVYPARFLESDELDSSDRGSNGFGSSGVR